MKGESNNVQLDFIAHKYPIVEKHNIYDSIRIASFEEIIAMKLNAIATNGTRIKGFIDIVFLSKYYSLNNMLSIYEKKYNANKLIALKSICYFDEINKDEPINYFNKKLSFNDITDHILKMVNDPENVIRLKN